MDYIVVVVHCGGGSCAFDVPVFDVGFVFINTFEPPVVDGL